jgi:hypothetical protein
MELEKCVKLIGRLQDLASRLAKNNEYIVHRRISQFFYMQKIEEMKILLEQLEEAGLKMEDVKRRIGENYIATYRTWRFDVRWLNNHEPNEESTKRIR